MSINPSFQMGWRYVTYREGRNAVSFSIEPMFVGPDIVYFPSKTSWASTAPDWLKTKREIVYEYLNSIKWNRELAWQASDRTACQEIHNNADNIIPGTLESTPGGKFLEDARFFHPDPVLSFEQARQIWFEADRKFTQQAKGKVTIFCDEIIPNSVFEKIELPELRKNPNITWDIRNENTHIYNPLSNKKICYRKFSINLSS